MTSFLHKLSYIGTGNNFSAFTNKRIVLCNRLSVICVAITIFFTGFYYSINQIRMVQIELVSVLFYLIPIGLNYYKWPIVSRIYFNILIFLHVTLLSTLVGKGAYMHEFFIPTIMVPFIFFEFSQKRIIIWLSIFNVLFVSFLFANDFSGFNSGIIITPAQLAILNKLIFFVNMFCCVIIIYSLLYVNEKISKQLDIDNETLQVQLGAIFNNSVDALFLVNWDERKIVKANQRAVEMFEAVSEQDFLQKYGLDLHKNYPTKDELEEMRNKLIEKGVYENEILYKTFLGREFWGAISVKVINIKGERFQSVRLTDISEQKRIKEQTGASLKEKELLLGEIHHRVKNNLAIISALINLQIENLKDNESKIIFEETKDRIYSMALIHNQLYQNKSFAQIEFAQYITNFCSYLSKSYQTNSNIELILKTEPVFLDIKTAIPCALILNELITNAFKHAFKNQASGKIEIGLKKEDNLVNFYVSDTGAGMDSIQLQASSMGMSLITSLIEQIDGKLDYKNQNGSVFLMTFSA
ncbi:MAG TPA: histidine kinase dimerization/phosphoacceptor domain -containing protein [Bacteroidia bacterium]|jgi:PAS domain S-box-containing protein|nr:histidine kinase dimerization/phosphoacceptor domain -containing protein [Bacteroidia bacterium]